MKKLFNHSKRPYEELEAYDELAEYENGDMDWDADYAQDVEYAEDADGFYGEDGNYYVQGEDGAYYILGEDGQYYLLEDEEAVEETMADVVPDMADVVAESEADLTWDAEALAEEDAALEADPIMETDAETEDGTYYEEQELFLEIDGTYYMLYDDGEYYPVEEEEYFAALEAAGYYVAEDGTYYAPESEEGAYEADAYYAEEEGDYEEDAYSGRKAPVYYEDARENVFARLWNAFLNMEMMDRVITATGAAVLLLAVVAGGIFVSSKMTDSEQVSALAEVGTQLEGIGVIGEQGLLAVADAEKARIEAAEALQAEKQQSKDYNESDYNKSVVVSMNTISVQKDLKIKFTNKSSGKLIANVPFEVTVTTPDDKTEVWTDDDMDGIIYKKGITPGNYKVVMNRLDNEKYKNYTITSEARAVVVREEIEYKKVDVKDEVKKESEVNVAKEDTKKKETVVESVLEDTVTWVESTAVANTYVEVAKSAIPDPTTLAKSGNFARVSTAAATVTPSASTVKVGGSATVTASYSGKSLTYISWDTDNSGVATVSGSGMTATVTGVGVGSATIIFTAYENVVSGGDIISSTLVQGTCSVTVTSQLGTITLDKTSATVFTTQSTTIAATITNADSSAVVTAESSDTNVATVSVSGTTVTVNGVKEGSATITVKCTQNGQTVQATCAVTVKLHPMQNTTTKLKDTGGNQLYVQDGDSYREAVYADYYNFDKFFVKGNVKYTGWQTLNGKVYFYDASGKKVTGEQVIQGAKYTFDSDGAMITGDGVMGIDVSKWNGTIDWEAVKNSGVSYVIIRCGYRGSSQGALIEDPKFEQNIKGATAAGLKVGVYFFTQAVDVVEAVYEASFVLDQVSNYKISYPIFLDVEASGGRGDKIDKATRTAVCKAFCETIQDAGYTAGIYANKTWLTNKINAGELESYKIWLAQYAATPTYSGKYDLWQYTESGKISGISGNVDLNISYLGY